MTTERSDEAGAIAGALAISARLERGLRDLGQSLGLERADAEDAGLLAAAGELQRLQLQVGELKVLLEGVAEDAG